MNFYVEARIVYVIMYIAGIINTLLIFYSNDYNIKSKILALIISVIYFTIISWALIRGDKFERRRLP